MDMLSFSLKIRNRRPLIAIIFVIGVRSTQFDSEYKSCQSHYILKQESPRSYQVVVRNPPLIRMRFLIGALPDSH